MSQQRAVIVLLAVALGLSIAAPMTRAASDDLKGARAELPREKAWQKALYRWLRSIEQEDVRVQQAELAWDGTHEDKDHLTRLWGALSEGRAYVGASFITRGPACWFVLDDGKGGGLEAGEHVKRLRWANRAAFWYQIDLPLKDGGQGNPYYRNEAVARRAMVALASDMMMLEAAMDDGHRTASHFLGGTMNGWTYAYEHCHRVLPDRARRAFVNAFRSMVRRLNEWGPADVLGNMDTRALPALASLYNAVDDAELRDLCLRTARLYLFGLEDGGIERIRPEVGLFRNAGYVDEKEGPETTYNGVSLYHTLEARAAAPDDGEWDFLDEVLRRMYTFKFYNYFRDPDGRWDGPAGYASRTGNSYAHDQRGRAWRKLTGAALYEEAHPLAGSGRNPGPMAPSPEQMIRDIRRVIENRYNGSEKMGQTATAEPDPWAIDHWEHWPPDIPYLPGDGLHEALAGIDPQAPSSKPPFAREGATFSKVFGPPSPEEFWAYRDIADDGTAFGFFVEHVPRQWPYASWAGGTLQAFWTEKTGLSILCFHDKTGPEPDDKENTGVWSQIDNWTTDHIWGRTSEGAAFSNARFNDHAAATVQGRWSGDDPNVRVASGLAHNGDPAVLPGARVISEFEAIQNGIRVTKRLEGNGDIRIDELRATIPVFLRNTKWQENVEATIEMRADNGWRTLPTELTRLTRLRLGRDFGDGPNYVYVTFSEPVRARRAEKPWQARYQSANRLRNIHVNLHPSPGRTASMPDRAALTYEVTATPP